MPYLIGVNLLADPSSLTAGHGWGGLAIILLRQSELISAATTSGSK
jgi:hypothetical protein